MEAVIRYADQNHDRFVRELVEWVAVPSVSALPERAADVRRSAEYLAAELRRLGGERVQILETDLHPAVYAEWMHAPGRPTLLVYGHHDVQPADPVDEWLSPPFQAEVRDGKLWGRGVVDDKGQVWIHVKAIEAFLRGGAGKLPVNLKLIVEGEEEIGSANLGGLLDEHADLLRADVVCVSDTSMYGRGVPSLCVGLRGLVYAEIRVSGPSSDLHSGSYGGSIANPANALARLLAGLHDADGRVTVPGFYDKVRALSAAERAEIAALGHDEAAWLRATGSPATFGEKGFSTLERVWARPTLDVCGLRSGFQGDGAKTIIPATATAKVSCRLVPDQSPDEIFALLEAHVRRAAPPGVRVDFVAMHGGCPYLAPTDHPVYEVARRAFSKAFGGKRTVFIREGGSIPFVRTIADATGKPCLLMGFGQPDEHAHAPNEWLDLENFRLGIHSAAYLYDEIARLSP